MKKDDVQEIERKKRYLKRYKKNLECITRLEERLSLLDARITSIRSVVITGMPRGGKPVTTADLIADKC